VAGDSLDLAFCDDATLDSLGSAVKALPKRRLRAAAQTVKKRLGAPSSLAEWLEWAGAAEFATTFEAIADDLDDLRELVEDDVNRLCPDAKPLRVKRILYYLDDLKQRPPVRRFSSRGSMLRASSARQSDSSSLLGVVADDVVAARESFTGGSFRESFSERGFALPPEEDEEEDDAAPPQDDDDDDDDDASTKECSSSRQHTPKTPGGVTTKTLRSRRQRPQRPRPPPPSSRARGRSKSPKPQPPPLPVRDYVVPTSESSSSSSSAADVPPPLPARDYLPSAASKTIEPIAESEDDEDAPPPLPVRDYERKHPMSEAYGNLVDIVFADGEVLTLDNLSMLADFHQDYDVPLEDRDQALAPRGWTVDDVEKILEYCNFLSNLGKDDGDSLDAQFRSQALAKFEKDNVILSDDRDRALHALDWTLDDYAALGSPLVASTPPGVPPPPLPPGSPARTSLSSSTSSTMTSRSRPVSERVTGAGTSSFHYNTTSETEDQVGALGMPPPGKSPPPPPPRRRVRTPLSTLPQRLRHTARSQGDKHSNLVKRFDVAALHAAIGNPPRLPLGQGGSARVFGGKLPDVGEVAIKRLSTDVSEPGGVDDRLFLKEVQILSKLRDPNVIRLLGFAQSDPTNNGGTTRMLVYELCKGGNLEVRLGKGDLSWAFRLEVARDAARGLFYLHSQQVDALYLHGDVKTANILLSARVLPAKLSDFGLARELDRGLTHASGALAGTIGYVCPAFARTGHLSPASDVYAMGVVFLSLVTGQKAIEKTRTPADLVSYARRQTKADVESWTQARRGDLGELSVAQGLIDIAWTCLADEPADRPTASELNDRLEELEHPHMTSRDLLSLEESAVFDFEDNDDADAQGTVKVLLGSFNVAGGSLNDDDLEQWLRRGEISTPGSSSPSSPAAGADVSQSSCADIVVVGLQECFNTMAPHHYTAMAGILQSHFSAGAPSSRGGSSAGSTSEEGAPLLEYVADASSGHTRLSMRLLVFVRKDRLRVEEVGKDSLTAGGVFKGCLASFLTVCDATGRRTSFIFANIHAPSGETKGDERNAAIHRATQRLKDIAGGGYRDATVFVFGPCSRLDLFDLSRGRRFELPDERVVELGAGAADGGQGAGAGDERGLGSAGVGGRAAAAAGRRRVPQRLRDGALRVHAHVEAREARRLSLREFAAAFVHGPSRVARQHAGGHIDGKSARVCGRRDVLPGRRRRGRDELVRQESTTDGALLRVRRRGASGVVGPQAAARGVRAEALRRETREPATVRQPRPRRPARVPPDQLFGPDRPAPVLLAHPRPRRRLGPHGRRARRRPLPPAERRLRPRRRQTRLAKPPPPVRPVALLLLLLPLLGDGVSEQQDVCLFIYVGCLLPSSLSSSSTKS